MSKADQTSPQLAGDPPETAAQFALGTGAPGLPAAAPRSRLRHLLNAGVRVSILRTPYHSARCDGWCIILRGTRLKMAPGARFCVDRGGRLVVGTRHIAGVPCSVTMGPEARLSVHGRAEIVRGTRVQVGPHAHLELGHRCYVAYNSP